MTNNMDTKLISINVPENVIPINNMSAYTILYIIEVVLREFIIITLGVNNSKWLKTRLPADLIEKIKEGRKYEESIKWTELLPHHPLYYLDFPDLKKIIDRKDNWDEYFIKYFTDKDVFISLLRELEPIRNKIAHHRLITNSDIMVLQAVYTAINNALGNQKTIDLVIMQTYIKNITTQFESLRKLVQECYLKCKKIQVLPSIEQWIIVKHSWWFDSDYLNINVSSIVDFFEIMDEYSKIPRLRGSGFLIEDWVNSCILDETYTKADYILSILINS
jgi:hypothetical protein